MYCDFRIVRETFLLRQQQCEEKMKVSERLGTVSRSAAAAAAAAAEEEEEEEEAVGEIS